MMWSKPSYLFALDRHTGGDHGAQTAVDVVVVLRRRAADQRGHLAVAVIGVRGRLAFQHLLDYVVVGVVYVRFHLDIVASSHQLGDAVLRIVFVCFHVVVLLYCKLDTKKPV